MFQSKFNRLIVAGIAAAAIAPTAAVASPATDGGTAADAGPRAPDQMSIPSPPRRAPASRAGPARARPGRAGHRPPVVAGPPTWPVNPQPIKTAAPTSATSDDGIDDGVLIALGGGALLLVAGVGVAGRKRLQVVRQRQLA